jgi:hypothetical protein
MTARATVSLNGGEQIALTDTHPRRQSYAPRVKAMRERGQVLIEMALVTPLLMLLIFIVLDVGLLLIRRATLDDAMRQGATEAAAGVAAEQAAVYTADRTMGLLGPEAITVCMVDAEHVRVSGDYTWKWLSGGIVAWLGGEALTDVVLHPTATRRLDIDAGPTPEPGVTPDPIETDAPPCD